MIKTTSLKNREFRNIYKNGKSVANNLIILYTLTNNLVSQNKLGICASKTVGNSIERHRATRLIRESYRLLEKEGNIKPGYSIVVVARKNILDMKMQDVKKSLAYLMKKVDLYVEIN